MKLSCCRSRHECCGCNRWRSFACSVSAPSCPAQRKNANQQRNTVTECWHFVRWCHGRVHLRITALTAAYSTMVRPWPGTRETLAARLARCKHKRCTNTHATSNQRESRKLGYEIAALNSAPGPPQLVAATPSPAIHPRSQAPAQKSLWTRVRASQPWSIL